MTLTTGSTDYFVANGTTLTTTIPMFVSGVKSDLVVSGTNSVSKFSVYYNSGSSLFNVDTLSSNIVLGTNTNQTNAQTTLYGNLNIGGIGYINKFTVASVGTTFLALDTINGTFQIANSSVLMDLNGYCVIGGAANSSKLRINDSDGAMAFGVDTQNGYIIATGIDSGTAAYKFSVLNQQGGFVFGVKTNSSVPATEEIVSKTIIPVNNTMTLGNSSNPWQMYGTVISASDRRLKKVGGVLDGASCVKLVRDLNIYHFEYIGSDRPYLGVMTDELRGIDPELAKSIVVDGEFEGISMYSFISVLMSAVKHLIVQNDQK
jgi:hypothetical protein